MQLWLEHRPYCRPFRQPLQTAHGLWHQRQGILLKLAAPSGQVGFGEIAPIPWFGTESMAAALTLCQELAGRQPAANLQAISAAQPACQFGFGLALMALQNPALMALQNPAQPPTPEAAAICALLPAGEAALAQWPALWQRGHRCLKWKIGVFALEQEQSWLRSLLHALPPEAKLRLDANGGLSPAAAERWLGLCDDAGSGRIELVEQPLPPEQVSALLALSQRHTTAIALDESVATLTQLRQWAQRGWPGVYVIKPAICGYPGELQQVLQTLALDCVFSSALETPIGRQGALALAQQSLLQSSRSGDRPARALGFGTSGWFADDWDGLTTAQLWEAL
jgi:o-succinylbenzoate synthase